MRKTQRMSMIEEIEASMAELMRLEYYAAATAIFYWRNLEWEEKKNFIPHSALKVMTGQIKKDLVAAKAARYDAIVLQCEQLLLLEDFNSSSNVNLDM